MHFQIIKFYLPRGQNKEDLYNLTRDEKVLFAEAMYDYCEFEKQKILAMLRG